MKFPLKAMKVSVVILNWNAEHLLRQFLPSVVRNSTLPDGECEVVVADNGSTDGSVTLIEEEFPSVRIIRLSENYGFAEGYNRALEQVNAEYAVLLNDDVEVTAGWLQPLVDFMDSHQNYAACQPKLLSWRERDHFEYAGACGGYLDSFGYPFCRGRIFDTVEADKGQYDTIADVLWATGACLMVRMEDYRRVGGLDGRFFAHMEEIDLCWRAKLLGYQVWCVPSSRVFHVGGGTLPNDSPRKLYLNFRNNLLMLYKNLPESIRLRRIFARMCLDGASAAVYLLTGNFASFKAVCRAHRDYRRMRSSVDESPFDGERNNVGYYPKSIVMRFFLSGKKLIFSDIHWRG